MQNVVQVANLGFAELVMGAYGFGGMAKIENGEDNLESMLFLLILPFHAD